MHFNEKILTHRKRMGLSQEELAARLGVSRQAVSKWELGTSIPDPSNIVALAKLFGISTDELLMDEPAQQAQDTPQAAACAPQTTAQTDFFDRLPGFLGRLIRKYSWLAGLYLMLGGLSFLLIGFLGRSSHDSMFGNLPDDFAGSMFSNSPFQLISNAALILGGIFTLAGLILAIVLYKKRPK